MAMMSRWISLVPPAEGQDERALVAALDAALELGARRVDLDVGLGAEALHEQAVGLDVELAAEDLGGRGVGRAQALVDPPGDLPVDELQELDLGVDLGQVGLHPFLVDDPPAVRELGLLGPFAGLGEGPLDGGRRQESDPLAVELVGDQLPALVLRSDQVGHRHPNVLVERLAGRRPADGPHRCPAEALGRGRHHDDRETLVAGGVGIGPARQPDVVGVLDEAGPHLLAVDDVLVAVPHGAGPQAGQVRAGVGFGVPDREVQLTLEDLGQKLELLLVGPVLHERRADRVDGENRDRRAGDAGLVAEDQLVHHRAGLAAVLLRPADAEPAVRCPSGRRAPCRGSRRRTRRHPTSAGPGSRGS